MAPPTRLRNASTIDSETCAKCNKAEDAGRDWISCDVCESWFHYGCSGLPSDLIPQIAKAKFLLFRCKLCLSRKSFTKPSKINEIIKSTLEATIPSLIETAVKGVIPSSLNIGDQPVVPSDANGPSLLANTQPKLFRPANTCSIRIRGITEPSGSINSRLQSDRKSVEEVVNHLGVKCQVTDIRRLGKFAPDSALPRTLLATVGSIFEKRLILSSLHKLKNYPCKVFLSRDLSSTELEIEHKLLSRRRELLNSGVVPKCLRYRDLKLSQYIDGTWLDVSQDV